MKTLATTFATQISIAALSMAALLCCISAGAATPANSSSTKATASKPAVKPIVKPVAKPVAKAAAKPATKTTVASVSATSMASVASSRSTIPSTSAAEAGLSPAVQAVVDQVQTGRMPCEHGAVVNVSTDASKPGRFYVESKGTRYAMEPVVTNTGTVKLEDRKAGVIWLQIANKSMLMNERQGQRMADECVSPAQAQVAANLRAAPALFDAPEGSR